MFRLISQDERRRKQNAGGHVGFFSGLQIKVSSLNTKCRNMKTFYTQSVALSVWIIWNQELSEMIYSLTDNAELEQLCGWTVQISNGHWDKRQHFVTDNFNLLQ